MKYLQDIYKKLMGSDGQNAVLLEKRESQANAIKQSMEHDVAKVKKKVDLLNQSTYTSLTEISSDLDSITYRIAIATGGKKRGLR